MAFNETDRYIPGDIGGACWSCGVAQRSDRGVKERLFRCDRDIDFEGFVVICESCVSDMARALGWMKPSEVRALKAKNTALLKEQRETLDALAKATATVDALRFYDEAGLSG